MIVTGIVAREVTERVVELRDGSGTRTVRSLTVLDESTGDPIEVTTWVPDARFDAAKSGQQVTFTAKGWNEYKGRLRIEAAPA